jgi:DNA-binding response OmpR family regulator
MKILIADDDDDLRDLIAMVLESAGYEVSANVNGRKAWESLQKDGADMAVLDINMPEMDGLELLDLIRGDERFKEMPVMLLTARRTQADQSHGMGRGADDYMTKPFENDALVKRVKMLEQAFPKNG